MSVTVLDYGGGNIASLINMFRRAGVDVDRARDAQGLRSARRVVLPGVGSFDSGMRRLTETGLLEPLRDYVASGRPLLGICLGMQLLVDGSAEGRLPGLGFIPGRCEKLPVSTGLKVPHMGWGQLRPAKRSSLIDELPDDHRFYFVHSYHVRCSEPEDELAHSDFGDPFTAMVSRDNVIGAQFHPEKSHAFGLMMLDQWVRSTPC